LEELTMDHASWATKARNLRLETRPLIDGTFVDSSCSKRYPDVNPANEEVLVEACEGSPEDVNSAVESARRAFRDGRWSRMAPQLRRDVLMRLVQLLIERREELALLDCLDVGKPIAQALDEVEMACGYLRFAAEACDKLVDGVIPSHPGLLALNVREPVGVVGAILPWNFPMVVVALKIAPALACGNSVVLKPSELSPLSALRIGAWALEAGIPPGVLNVVPGLGPVVGRAIAEHRDIDMLTFTGSTATGRSLMQSAGKSNLKKLLLECGGKSPHIVFADVLDLDVVAGDVVEQVTWNQGQVCVAGSRLLVQAAIHADLVQRVIERMAAIRPGEPLDPATSFGPLVSSEHLKKVMGYIEAAKASGARLRVGGRRLERRGFFIEPTVFDDVGSDQPIAREEVFGPVLTVTPFNTMDEAISIAHAVDYGLSARIWSRDLATGYSLARRLRAGEVTVNAAPASAPGVGAASATEPFGQSGFGIEGGLEGLRQYTRLKAIHMNLPLDGAE
jgi:acyl-CoA reductase-like NAD-dependent aldehyde dehydrogenase